MLSCRLFFNEFQNSPMQQSSEENPSSRSDTGDPPNQHVVVNSKYTYQTEYLSIKDKRC